MFTRTIGRVGAAAVFAVGLLIATAAPASAVDTTYELHIDDGSSITIGGTNTEFGSHPTDNVCASNSTDPSPLVATWDDTTGLGTVAPLTTGWGDFTAGTNTFKSRLVVTGGTVAVTTTTVTVTLSIRAEFRTCDSLTPLCTTNLLGPTLSGSNTTSTITPSVSDVIVLLGTVHVTVPTTPGACNPVIRAALHSQTANIVIVLHVTAVI